MMPAFTQLSDAEVDALVRMLLGNLHPKEDRDDPTSHSIAPLLLLSVSALFACGGGDDAKEAASTSEKAAMAETGGPTVVASGLNAPMGVLVDDDGTIWITDSGTGGTDSLAGQNPVTGEKAKLPRPDRAPGARGPVRHPKRRADDLPSVILPDAPIGAARLARWNGSLPHQR